MTSIWLILILSTSVFGQHYSEITKESAITDMFQVFQKPSEDLHQIVQNVDTLWAPGTPWAILPLGTDATLVVGGNLLTASIPSIVGEVVW